MGAVRPSQRQGIGSGIDALATAIEGLMDDAVGEGFLEDFEVNLVLHDV